jgi:hypothetical protein
VFFLHAINGKKEEDDKPDMLVSGVFPVEQAEKKLVAWGNNFNSICFPSFVLWSKEYSFVSLTISHFHSFNCKKLIKIRNQI